MSTTDVHNHANNALACCLLTSTGRAAVAVIGLSGRWEDQVKTIDKLFQPVGGQRFQSIAKRPIAYGRWQSTQEDLVVTRSPQGYEIQCHGGNVASQAVIGDLQDCGFTVLDQHNWQCQSTNIWITETQRAICEAKTNRTVKLLLSVLQAQPAALRRLDARERTPQINQTIQRMLVWSDFGRFLTQPRTVVFCGQPNVGKSSLVNAIAGFERAIVNEQAGTTRDVLGQATAIDGWPVLLQDTAGLRETADPIERRGIESARQAIEDAQLRILVLDATHFLTIQSPELAATIDALNPQIVVINKIDLAPQLSLPNRLHGLPTVAVSAATGLGIADLIDQTAQTLVPDLPPAAQWYPVTSLQIEMLKSRIQA